MEKQELVAIPHLLPLIFYLQEKNCKDIRNLSLTYETAQEISTHIPP